MSHVLPYSQPRRSRLLYRVMESIDLLSDRFVDGVRCAALIHADQRRKGTDVPYLGHLLAVASLVIDAGGDEDEAIAALLHDAAEDQGGERRLEDIRTRFDKRVAGIVQACS